MYVAVTQVCFDIFLSLSSNPFNVNADASYKSLGKMSGVCLFCSCPAGWPTVIARGFAMVNENEPDAI